MYNDETIDQILEKAFSENGISRWCSGIRTIKAPESNEDLMLNQAISRGAVLKLHVRDDWQTHAELSRQNLSSAITSKIGDELNEVEKLSVESADELVQLAVFGEVKYKSK